MIMSNVVHHDLGWLPFAILAFVCLFFPAWGGKRRRRP